MAVCWELLSDCWTFPLMGILVILVICTHAGQSHRVSVWAVRLPEAFCESG